MEKFFFESVYTVTSRLGVVDNIGIESHQSNMSDVLTIREKK